MVVTKTPVENLHSFWPEEPEGRVIDNHSHRKVASMGKFKSEDKFYPTLHLTSEASSHAANAQQSR